MPMEIGVLIQWVEKNIIPTLPKTDSRCAEDLIIWWSCWCDADSIMDDLAQKDAAEMFRDGIKPKTLEDYADWYMTLDSEDQEREKMAIADFYKL